MTLYVCKDHVSSVLPWNKYSFFFTNNNVNLFQTGKYYGNVCTDNFLWSTHYYTCNEETFLRYTSNLHCHNSTEYLYSAFLWSNWNSTWWPVTNVVPMKHFLNVCPVIMKRMLHNYWTNLEEMFHRYLYF